jgi:hypothetical protein
VIIGHDDDTAMNVVGEEIGYKKRLAVPQSPLGDDIGRESWRCPFAMLGAEGTETLYGGIVIPVEVEPLGFDGAEMRKMTGPPRQWVDTHLETHTGGLKSLSRVKESAFRFHLPELDHQLSSPCHHISQNKSRILDRLSMERTDKGQDNDGLQPKT